MVKTYLALNVQLLLQGEEGTAASKWCQAGQVGWRPDGGGGKVENGAEEAGGREFAWKRLGCHTFDASQKG